MNAISRSPRLPTYIPKEERPKIPVEPMSMRLSPPHREAVEESAADKDPRIGTLVRIPDHPLSHRILELLDEIQGRRQDPLDCRRGPHFSPQQLNVMRELCDRGKRNKAIGAALGIAPLTVRDHLRDVRAKIGVRTRGEVIAFCAASGLFRFHWSSP